jgi:hypothetical protein
MVSSLRDAGVSAADAQALARRAKPYIQLECNPADDEAEIALGATKIGGTPDLPAGMPWPWRPPYPDHEQRLEELKVFIGQMRQRDGALDALSKALPPPGRSEDYMVSFERKVAEDTRWIAALAPLAFIAQIDLAAVWLAGQIDPDIPREGRLLFFYDTGHRPEGNKPADITGAQLIYDLTPAAALIRAASPAELMQLKKDASFPAQRCILRAAISPPSHLSLGWEACAMKGKSKNAAEKWWGENTDGSHDHRVGGHPIQIQGYDMQIQSALASKGRSYTPAAVKAVKSEANNWLLLLQIASDKSARMMWGDMGNLYVWIRRDALRERRFEEARVISQCF